MHFAGPQWDKSPSVGQRLPPQCLEPAVALAGREANHADSVPGRSGAATIRSARCVTAVAASRSRTPSLDVEDDAILIVLLHDQDLEARRTRLEIPVRGVTRIVCAGRAVGPA